MWCGSPRSSAIGALGGASLTGNNSLTCVGSRSVNLLIADSPSTPNIVGLEGGNDLSDANGDGDSDGADLLAWQRQLGGGPAGASRSQAAVPEPAAMILACMAAFLMAAACGRRLE